MEPTDPVLCSICRRRPESIDVRAARTALHVEMPGVDNVWLCSRCTDGTDGPRELRHLPAQLTHQGCAPRRDVVARRRPFCPCDPITTAGHPGRSPFWSSLSAS